MRYLPISRILCVLLMVWSVLLSATTVKLISNFETPTELMHSFSRFCNHPGGRWNDLQLTDAEKADYYCVINFPMPGVFYEPNKTILIEMESLENRKTFFPKNWIEPDARSFFYYYNQRNSIEWHLDKTYVQLSQEEIKKDKLISSVTSSEYRLPGHIKRVQFLRYLDDIDFCYDLYGRSNTFHLKQYKGALPHKNKNEGLLPYKYTIACENGAEEGYFTEKLVDSILAECLCFYYGCPDVEQYIDPRAYIRIDIDNPAQAVEVIRTAMNASEWEKRIEIIRSEKKRILNEMQIMPTLERIIRMPVRVINLDRRPDRWAAFKQQAQKQHLDHYTRFSAIDGRTLVLNEGVKTLFEIPPHFVGKRWNITHGYQRGQIGCALSHLLLWKELTHSPSDVSLIFEDDVELCPDFCARWDAIYSKLALDPDWDMVFLGFFDDTPEIQNKYGDTVACEGVMRFSPVMRKEGGGTCAYCIRKKGAMKLLELANRLGIQQAIDHFIIDQFDTLNVYRTYPHLAKAKQYGVDDKVDSDIQGQEKVFHYYSTAADEVHFPLLMNLIGSIHRVDFDALDQIAVFDLGLTQEQVQRLENIQKVKVYAVEKTHPDLLTYFQATPSKKVRGWYAWKPVVLKQSLELFPYLLYLDAGTLVLSSPDDLFKHIKEQGYFFVQVSHNIVDRLTRSVMEKVVGQLPLEDQKIILNEKTMCIAGGVQGVSRDIYEPYILPMYAFSSDLTLFADDGSAKLGFGAARHDQSLFSLLAARLKLDVHNGDGWSTLKVDGREIPFHYHWDAAEVNPQTVIYSARWNLQFSKGLTDWIR